MLSVPGWLRCVGPRMQPETLSLAPVRPRGPLSLRLGLLRRSVLTPVGRHAGDGALGQEGAHAAQPATRTRAAVVERIGGDHAGRLRGRMMYTRPSRFARRSLYACMRHAGEQYSAARQRRARKTFPHLLHMRGDSQPSARLTYRRGVAGPSDSDCRSAARRARVASPHCRYFSARCCARKSSAGGMSGAGATSGDGSGSKRIATRDGACSCTIWRALSVLAAAFMCMSIQRTHGKWRSDHTRTAATAQAVRPPASPPTRRRLPLASRIPAARLHACATLARRHVQPSRRPVSARHKARLTLAHLREP